MPPVRTWSRGLHRSGIVSRGDAAGGDAFSQWRCHALGATLREPPLAESATNLAIFDDEGLTRLTSEMAITGIELGMPPRPGLVTTLAVRIKTP